MWVLQVYIRAESGERQRVPKKATLHIVTEGRIFSLPIRFDVKWWDVNSDRVVDIFDLVTVAREFGGRVDIPFPLRLRPVDVNGDGEINAVDLREIGEHFGEQYEDAAAPPAPLSPKKNAQLVKKITNPEARQWVEDFLHQRIPNPQGKKLLSWGALKKGAK
jgi:hypothetical protein